MMITPDKIGHAREIKVDGTLLCCKSGIGRVVSSYTGKSVLPCRFPRGLVAGSLNQRTLVITIVVAQLRCDFVCLQASSIPTDFKGE